MNDNSDGTLSIVGSYSSRTRSQPPPLVISRKPLDPNEPPMAAYSLPSNTSLPTDEDELSSVRMDLRENPTHTPKTSQKDAPRASSSAAISQEEIIFAAPGRPYKMWKGKRQTHLAVFFLAANTCALQMRKEDWSPESVY